MSTVLETIEGGTKYLEKRGIEDARRNMQLMVAQQLGCTRMELYTQFDRSLEESQLVPLREMLKTRGEGVPLQHILGTVWFHGREFRCDARALIPRPETEELAEWVLSWELPDACRVLDMGCGSGVLGLTLASEKPAWHVTLADVSEPALTLTKENATRLGITNATFVLSDLFQQLAGPFDLIVANLPYVPGTDRSELSREVQHDPALALFGGNDGLDVIRRFLAAVTDFLTPGGRVAMEIGIGQAEEVTRLMSSAGLLDVEVKTDLSGIARFPAGRKA